MPSTITPAWWRTLRWVDGGRNVEVRLVRPLCMPFPLAGELWQGNRTLMHAKNNSGKRQREWLGRTVPGSLHSSRLVGLTDEGRKIDRENAEQRRTFTMTTTLARTYFYLLTKPLGDPSCSETSPGPRVLLHTLLSMSEVLVSLGF